MQYSEGTVSTTNGNHTVTGSGTKWRKFLRAGDLISIANSGIWYQVARVIKQTELKLSVPYTGATAAGQSYLVMREFTPFAGFPYPLRQDIDKASIISRGFQEVDLLLQAMHDRLDLVEFPPMTVPSFSSTPDIQVVQASIIVGITSTDANMTPTIGVVNIPPVSLDLVALSLTSTPDIPAVSIGALALASSNVYTADASNVTADGAVS